MSKDAMQASSLTRTKNFKHTGLQLSDPDLYDVRVHMNSSKPAVLQAHAYATADKIQLSPASDKVLPHEAWHVVQQRQGRVKPTLQM